MSVLGAVKSLTNRANRALPATFRPLGFLRKSRVRSLQDRVRSSIPRVRSSVRRVRSSAIVTRSAGICAISSANGASIDSFLGSCVLYRLISWVMAHQTTHAASVFVGLRRISAGLVCTHTIYDKRSLWDGSRAGDGSRRSFRDGRWSGQRRQQREVFLAEEYWSSSLIVPTQGSNLRLQTNRFSVKARCP